MYGVTYTKQVYTPGDERSRTNPGHGYPESWDTVTEFKEFTTEDSLVSWLSLNGSASADLKVFKMMPLEVETKTTIKVKAKSTTCSWCKGTRTDVDHKGRTVQCGACGGSGKDE